MNNRNKHQVFVFIILGILNSAAEGIGPIHPHAAKAVCLRLHQTSMEGWNQDIASSPQSVVDLFRLVFSSLPGQVRVYPSENYFYFDLSIGGTDIHGNIRIAPGYRDKGIVPFAYTIRSYDSAGNTISYPIYKHLGQADGVLIQEINALSYQVTFEGKKVVFHLNRLDQNPPAELRLRTAEVFVERTLDESGCPFLLVFDETRNSFVWILDEERPMNDSILPCGDGVIIARRTGFVFWEDPIGGGRKVLIGVSHDQVLSNGYYDGPFDQLADNDARQVNIQGYLEKAYPQHKGKLDLYGYYDRGGSKLRVAPANYRHYEEMSGFIEESRRIISEREDPLEQLTREEGSALNEGAGR